MTTKKKLTRADKKTLFLKKYMELGTIEQAAKETAVTRMTPYNWLSSDKDFKVRFEKVKPIGKGVYLGVLEDEARRRAVDGVLEGVYYQGELVDHVRKFSDVLLIVLLKANAPEKYRERQEITGAGGLPLLQPIIQVMDLETKELYLNGRRTLPQANGDIQKELPGVVQSEQSPSAQ
jgi:hypothetical protein